MQIEDAKSVLKVAADSDKDGTHRKFNSQDLSDGSQGGPPGHGRGPGRGRGKRF